MKLIPNFLVMTTSLAILGGGVSGCVSNTTSELNTVAAHRDGTVRARRIKEQREEKERIRKGRSGQIVTHIKPVGGCSLSVDFETGLAVSRQKTQNAKAVLRAKKETKILLGESDQVYASGGGC